MLIADPADDPDVGDFFSRLPDADYLPTWYARTRSTGALGAQEQAAARKTESHADTPAIAHVDSLGRTFLTVAHNKFERNRAMARLKRLRRATQPASCSTSKATSAKSSTPRTASSCATTTTCSATGSIRPAWRPASAGC